MAKAENSRQARVINSSHRVIAGENKRNWENPLRGNYKKTTLVKVSAKGLGLMIGVKVKF
jgi:hypothetical protein|tara:strand:- start:310 stop:489 length:180 start_codon:yes stop_codon:yes gene_type:complete